MRKILIILLFLPFLLFAQSGKVVGVIPVKFSGKGLHAPLPYNQQLMQRGWTRVPTVNLPVPNPSAKNPRYQPTKMTKRSIARSLGYLAGRVGSMTPATKALLIGYGAYEANCLTQNYPSLCIDGPEIPGTTCEIGDAKVGIGCTTGTRFEEQWKWTLSKTIDGVGVTKIFFGSTKQEAQDAACAWSAEVENNRSSNNYSCRQDGLYLEPCNFVVVDGETVCKFGAATRIPLGGTAAIVPAFHMCPPKDPKFSAFTNLIKHDDTNYCSKPFDSEASPVPVDADWIEDKIDQNPAPIAEVGLDDFVDWETGLPRPDAFEDPKFDPVSDAFADAAEAIANGTVQHSNPAGEGYVSPEIMPNLLVQINNWHEGNTFVDVFNDNKEITPEKEQEEEPTETDWSKFPGITKAQYEASNNAWGNAATNGKPDINSELDKLTQEQQKLTDFINEPLPDLPYEIDFPSLFQLPTNGQCAGFTVTGTVRGVASPIIVDKHCPPYEAWGRPVIEWFLGIMTIFQCFHIFRRTLEVA